MDKDGRIHVIENINGENAGKTELHYEGHPNTGVTERALHLVMPSGTCLAEEPRSRRISNCQENKIHKHRSASAPQPLCGASRLRIELPPQPPDPNVSVIAL